MNARRKKKIRVLLLVAAGAALTSLMAGELLPSRGKPSPQRAEWVEIGVATDGTKAFVNRQSITETGPRVALWQRFALGTVKAHTGAAGIVEQLVVYDCPARSVSTLESREMSAGGAVLRARRFRPPVHDSIKAATLPEYIYDAVC